jgi:hypothetical protein
MGNLPLRKEKIENKTGPTRIFKKVQHDRIPRLRLTRLRFESL